MNSAFYKFNEQNEIIPRKTFEKLCQTLKETKNRKILSEHNNHFCLMECEYEVLGRVFCIGEWGTFGYYYLDYFIAVTVYDMLCTRYDQSIER